MIKISIQVIIVVLLFSGCGIIVKKSPSYAPEELKILGEHYVQAGIDSFQRENYQAALSEWRKALGYIPGDAEVYNFMGIAFHRVGMLDSSITYYGRAVELDPAYYQALNNTGYVYFLKGDYEKALQYFDKTLQINPSYERAITNREKCIEIMEGLLPVAAFELFENAKALDSLELKIKNYRKALALDSNYTDAWNNLGVVYHYYGYLDSSIYCLKRALMINPKHPQANNNMAFLLDAAGQYDQAVKLYQTALHAKPDYTTAMINLGDTYVHLGKADLARALWENALRLEPSD
ncbi:MAG: tetratricopeptide repeat protein, partial [Calditrichia bacterium]